jgi:hypothetical protein
MIKELSVDFDVKACCEALSVSRSGYYRWQQAESSRREKENAQLIEEIDGRGPRAAWEAVPFMPDYDLERSEVF